MSMYLWFTGTGRTLGFFSWRALLLVSLAQPAWSAITLVGSTAPALVSSNVTSLTLAYPAGLAADDILVAQISVADNQTITAPAGWNLINRSNNGSALTQAAYWKRAGASNPASDTWSWLSSDRAAGTMVAYRDVDPVAPVNAFSVSSNPGSSLVTASSLTPTIVGTHLVGLFAMAHGNAIFAPPAGVTEREDAATGAGPNGIAVELADEAYAGGTAATGSRVATASESASSVAHLVALQPAAIARYRMDEAAWSGSAGEVADSSGRAYHATATNGAITAGTVPAISGSPGTCNYGSFDGSNDYVAVPSAFPNLTTDFTLAAWIRTTNNAKSGQRIFIDDQSNSGGYGFSLGDGGAGRLRFYARATRPVSLDTANVIQNNTWYFVAATMNATAKTKSMYVYDQAGAQLAFVTQTYTGTWGTDAGAASIGGENNASTESGSGFKFSGSLDEVSVFSGALSAVKLGLVMNQTRPCAGSPPVSPSGFNAFETTTAAGSVAGVIRTKVAASPFGLDVVAIRTGGTAVETAFTGSVRIELVDASSGAGCNAFPLIRNLGTLTYASADMGRKLLAGINEPNAWPNARIRMSYPATGTPTVVACSTDNFAIRPASFAGVSITDQNWQTAGTTRTLDNVAATGGRVHRAGRPFSLVATALPTSATNYTGAPGAVLSACVGTGCTTTFGTFSVGAAAVSGVINSTTATYSEVGAFSMQLRDQTFAAVDAGDTAGDCSPTGRYVCSASLNVGRFVPDHFVVETASTPQFRTFNETAANCAVRPFTYMGQPFGYVTLPQATITAKNAAGGTTLNYSSTLWKLTDPVADVTQTYAASNPLDTGLLGVPVIASTGSGTGTLSAHADDVIAFVRPAPILPATLPNPFAADIVLTMRVKDSSENAVTGNGDITTTTPAVFNGTGLGIGFDDGNQIRFGRLALSNAHGSELLGLPVPIEAQFWSGAGFVRNADDSCTQLIQDHVALSNWQRNLNACETSVTLAGRFTAGRGNLRLSAPGATAGVPNTGSVNLTLNLGAVGAGSTCVGGAARAVTGADMTWLRVRGGGAAYDQDPVVRASFGLYRGSKPLIYMRERY